VALAPGRPLMMTRLRTFPVAAPGARNELLLVMAGMWLILAAIPLGLGGMGISWDALNHHVYLGWTAFNPRFDRDWLAASYQSYQYPYLYWPFYKLVQLQVSGMWAGVVLVSLHILVVPALWLIARTCVPVRSWEGTLLRAGAVLLAFLGQLTLSLMDNTANDLYAGAPLVWAVALGLIASQAREPGGWLTPARAVALSGAFAGLAIAFKFSNGPLVLVVPLLWALAPGTPLQRLGQVLRGTSWSIVAFVLAYGWWGWQMWHLFGNPMYPLYDPWFAVLRELAEWRQP
jgi:hypothetical protein